MKKLDWFKNHKIATIVILILLIWVGEKLWSYLSYLLFFRAQPTYVETVILKPTAGTQQWQAVGTVKAAQNIIVNSEVTGVVQSLAVTNNQTVKQGDVLLSIQHDDISANLQRDQAALSQKQLYYQRVQRLPSSAISQDDMSKALSDFQQAQAAVAADLALLNKYIIKAPFTGVIGIWQINIGQLVQPGDHLVTLTQLSPSYIDFMLPAKVLSAINVGDDIQFTTTTYANRLWHGKVIAIDPQLDSTTRNVQLRAQVDNSDNKLVPYLYGQITVVKQLPPQLFIPQEAVIYDPQGTSVYVVKKNKAYSQPVQLGLHQQDNVIVEKGLKPGDEVVTAGMMKLFPSAPVSVNHR